MAITLNPSDKSSSITLSNGNMTLATSGSVTNRVKATESLPVGKKVYFEYRQDYGRGTNSGYLEFRIAFARKSTVTTAIWSSYGESTCIGIEVNSQGKIVVKKGSYTDDIQNWYEGVPLNSIIGVAYDSTNPAAPTIKIYVNGVLVGEPFTSAEILSLVYLGGGTLSELTPIFTIGYLKYGTFNAGVTPFFYPAPEGYEAWDKVAGEPVRMTSDMYIKVRNYASWQTTGKNPNMTLSTTYNSYAQLMSSYRGSVKCNRPLPKDRKSFYELKVSTATANLMVFSLYNANALLTDIYDAPNVNKAGFFFSGAGLLGSINNVEKNNSVANITTVTTKYYGFAYDPFAKTWSIYYNSILVATLDVTYLGEDVYPAVYMDAVTAGRYAIINSGFLPFENSIPDGHTSFETKSPVQFDWLTKNNSAALSNNNMTCSPATGQGSYVPFRASKAFPTGRNVYYEITLGGISSNISFSIHNEVFVYTSVYSGYNPNMVQLRLEGNYMGLYSTTKKESNPVSWTGNLPAGTVISIAFNPTAKTFRIYFNGEFKYEMQPEIINQLGNGVLYPGFGTGGISITANFGATQFKYQIPDGYTPLDLSNWQMSMVADLTRSVTAATSYRLDVDLLRIVQKSISQLEDVRRRVVVNKVLNTDLRSKNLVVNTLVDDLQRKIVNSVTYQYDLKRGIEEVITLLSDLRQKNLIDNTLHADLYRIVTAVAAYKLNADILRKVVRSQNLKTDLLRKLTVNKNTKYKLRRSVTITIKNRVIGKIYRRVVNSNKLKIQTLRQVYKTISQKADAKVRYTVNKSIVSDLMVKTVISNTVNAQLYRHLIIVDPSYRYRPANLFAFAMVDTVRLEKSEGRNGLGEIIPGESRNIRCKLTLKHGKIVSKNGEVDEYQGTVLFNGSESTVREGDTLVYRGSKYTIIGVDALRLPQGHTTLIRGYLKWRG